MRLRLGPAYFAEVITEFVNAMEPTPAPPGPQPTSRRTALRRLVLRWLGILCLTWIILIVMLLMLENKLVFHPYKDTDSWMPPPKEIHAENVSLPLADGKKVHGWWCPKAGASGALLYLHGNAGNVSHRGHSIAVLQQALGLSVLIVDYPGFGKSEGSPTEAGCYASADAAYDWLLEKQKMPPEKIVIFGKSLGGGVAVDLAVRKEHRALILVNTFTSAPDMAQKMLPFVPARWLMRNQFNSAAKIGRCNRPIFCAHGDCDSVVPCELGQRLFAAAPEPKQFFLMKGHDHNDAFSDEFLQAMKAFLANQELPEKRNPE